MQAIVPSLHHRKEGWLRHQKISRSHQSRRSRGGFPFCVHRKTTPASRSADASQFFLNRSATPPCGDARRGACVIKKILRSHRLRRRRGGFPLLYESENHPGLAISGGFALFLDRSATPPCGDARRGLCLIPIRSQIL